MLGKILTTTTSLGSIVARSTTAAADRAFMGQSSRRSLTKSNSNQPTPSKQPQDAPYRQIKTNCTNKNAFGATKILTADDKNNDVLLETNIELNDLEINLKDGRRLVFNLTWLRDSCHCSACTHQYSRQRLFTPKDFQRYMFEVKDVQILETAECQNKDLAELQLSRICWPRFVEHQESAEAHLQITWADDHRSLYSIEWLNGIANLYAQQQLRTGQAQSLKFHLPQDDFYHSIKSKTLELEYWSVARINQCLEPVDYHDLTDGFDFKRFNDPTFINANQISEMSSKRLVAMRELSKQLVTFGLAKIINVPQQPGQVLNVARSLAYERPTGYGTVFDVVVEPSEEINLAYSAEEFDLHTDLPYRESSPGVQLLHCISNSSIGGLSYFCDAFNAAQQLRTLNSELFETLVKFPATFVVRDPYRDIKFRRQQPIISLDYQGDLEAIHYSPFTLPPVGHKNDVKLYYLSLDKFTQLLQSKENKLIVKMEPGDLFIFHNRRVLHGRSSYDPTSSKRFLQGCYMDWDEVRCLQEKLHSYRSNSESS